VAAGAAGVATASRTPLAVQPVRARITSRRRMHQRPSLTLAQLMRVASRAKAALSTASAPHEQR
jgi:hypothetical protein